jgi:hypothetical protein
MATNGPIIMTQEPAPIQDALGRRSTVDYAVFSSGHAVADIHPESAVGLITVKE